MAAKGIFVFVSLCFLAFAFGKPQSQVIMVIMSHNYHSWVNEYVCMYGKQYENSDGSDFNPA